MKAKFILIAFLALALPAWADMSKEEREAYQAWYDANAAEDWPKAIEAAKVYRDSFPQGEYADYLKKWDRGLRVKFFSAAVTAKNSAEMIKRGSDLLAEEPDNLDILWALANALRVNEIYAKPPVMTHGGEEVAFAVKAAQLIESGKVPSNVDKDKWNKNTALATLYQAAAFVEKTNKNADRAIEFYAKAAHNDPSNPNNWLSAGILSYSKYQEAARKYRELAKDPSNTDKPELKMAKDEADKRADAAIEYYTEFLDVTQDNAAFAEQRAKVEKGLADAQKFRNPAPATPAPSPPPPAPAPETKSP